MSAASWGTAEDIRQNLLKRWRRGELLVEALYPDELFPLRLPLKHPTAKALGNAFAAAQQWVQQLKQSTLANTATLEWKTINHRQLGRNQLPTAVIFNDLAQAIRFIGKTTLCHHYVRLSGTLLEAFPSLKPWVLKYPHQVLTYGDVWPQLMRVLTWVLAHPQPRIYLRQLTLESIDTKFIERHKKILGQWFDLTLPEQSINAQHSGVDMFEQRYGFRSKPQRIRFRLLDENLYIGGLSDLSVNLQEFSRLTIMADTVFITENDINALAFPDFPSAIILFGRGYGCHSLADVKWLEDKRIIYWGDIDTHGFAILNQFRRHLPQTQSLLMDRKTLLAHQAHWTTEPRPSHAQLTYLTSEENALLSELRSQRLGQQIRLEQEYISFAALQKALNHLV